ncbi:hypothetical protein H4Q26_011636 [Puccinia striiformis f. sp. tritici PST-130]|nr:hypothetical protein H4Q26_011636 [Puccinia striiformis f. sp. tritici PST-130]
MAKDDNTRPNPSGSSKRPASIFMPNQPRAKKPRQAEAAPPAPQPPRRPYPTRSHALGEPIAIPRRNSAQSTSGPSSAQGQDKTVKPPSKPGQALPIIRPAPTLFNLLLGHPKPQVRTKPVWAVPSLRSKWNREGPTQTSPTRPGASATRAIAPLPKATKQAAKGGVQPSSGPSQAPGQSKTAKAPPKPRQPVAGPSTARPTAAQPKNTKQPVKGAAQPASKKKSPPAKGAAQSAAKKKSPPAKETERPRAPQAHPNVPITPDVPSPTRSQAIPRNDDTSAEVEHYVLKYRNPPVGPQGWKGPRPPKTTPTGSPTTPQQSPNAPINPHVPSPSRTQPADSSPLVGSMFKFVKRKPKTIPADPK